MPISIRASKTELGFKVYMDEQDLFEKIKMMVEFATEGNDDPEVAEWDFEVIKI